MKGYWLQGIVISLFMVGYAGQTFAWEDPKEPNFIYYERVKKRKADIYVGYHDRYHSHPLPEGLNDWFGADYGNQGGEPSAIVRDGDWKLIRYWEDNRLELYNLAEDPSEQLDLAKNRPLILNKLSKKLICMWGLRTSFTRPQPSCSPATTTRAGRSSRPFNW